MVKKNASFWLRLILVISTIMYLFGCPSSQEEKQLDSGTLDFTINTIEGKEVRLKDYRGKKIVHLVFWATWCPACLMEMPKLQKLYHAIGDKPYEILAIDVGLSDSLKRVKYFQERQRLPFKILFDEKGEVSKRCGIIGVPTHIIIDKKGIIKERFNQLPEDLKKHLSQLFSH